MLSVLIPIYNFKVVKLVDALQKQCVKAKINYEIICFDDQSFEKFREENRILSNYFGVNYTELSENLGRAKIRNWLAKIASYENLIFLDCDSKIISKTFIKDYLNLIPEYEVVSGGRKYSKKAPRAKSKKLHWLYGTKKEHKKAKYRNRNPIIYFHSNNFLVKRDIMIKYGFDEEVEGYGYEDLFWAKKLYNKGIRIRHIDNETEHLGLEKNNIFLKKAIDAIDNLIHHRSLSQIETNLTRFAHKIEGLKLKSIVLNYFTRNEHKIMANLMSANPKLRNLDLYKLYYYFSKSKS